MSHRTVKPPVDPEPARPRLEPVNPAPRYFRRHRPDAVQGFVNGTTATDASHLTRRARKARARILRLAQRHPR
jgi:hypothetical protein